MVERVRILVEGTDFVLHEGPRSWSSDRGPDRLWPYGTVLDVIGRPIRPFEPFEQPGVPGIVYGAEGEIPMSMSQVMIIRDSLIGPFARVVH